ncbi:MAG: hypothetical protein RR100_20620, partial [Comamonas sp.]
HISGGCLSRVTKERREFRRASPLQAPSFLSRFLLTKQKKPGRCQATPGLEQKCNNKQSNKKHKPSLLMHATHALEAKNTHNKKGPQPKP